MFPLIYRDIYKTPSNYRPPDDPKDLIGNTHYPNLNSRDYTARGINHTPRMQKAWECISLNADGHAVIGTNKLNGREWYATLWGFEQLDDIKETTSCFKLRLKSLISCLKYVSNNIYILGLQNGQVQVWSTYVRCFGSDENPYCPFKIGDKIEHLTPVTCLDVLNNMAATGSKDGTLKLWDMTTADLFSTHTFVLAHLDCITGVSAKPSDENVFATCSLDRSVLLWDIRLPRPASALFECHSVAFKSVVWNSKPDSSFLVVGDEIGFIRTIDKRFPKQFVTSNKWLDRSVRKLFSHENNFAVIGDTNQVKILKGKEVQQESESSDFYENKDSENFVRDGVWFSKNEFLTVGFDGKLRNHNLDMKKSSPL